MRSQSDADMRRFESLTFDDWANLIAEVERLTRERDAARGLNNRYVCAYCGYSFKRAHSTEETQAVMADHVADCEKHPLRHLAIVTAERDQAQAACAEMGRALEVLRTMARRLAVVVDRYHSNKYPGNAERPCLKEFYDEYPEFEAAMKQVATPGAPLLARLGRLERLSSYSNHLGSCGYHEVGGHCDCGYTEALAACEETDATQKR